MLIKCKSCKEIFKHDRTERRGREKIYCFRCLCKRNSECVMRRNKYLKENTHE